MDYELEREYWFEIKPENANSIFYTGIVLEQDNTHLRIHTIKGENITIRKADIFRAIETEGGKR